MACLSNTPSFTYVSVQNMVIGYKNIYYNIKNMYSSDKYFYWDKNESPFELITSNTTLESKEGLFLIVVNNKGTFLGLYLFILFIHFYQIRERLYSQIKQK